MRDERRAERVDLVAARPCSPRRRGGRRGACRCPAQASRPPSRSKAGIERPEPVPWSPSSATSTPGGVALGDARGDDPDHAGVPVLGGEHVGRRLPRLRATCASASQRMRCSTCAALGVERGRARRRSAPRAAASSVSSSSSAASARCRRPAALSRGARRKPTARASTRRGSTCATRISARRPGLRASRAARQALAHEAAVLAAQRDAVGHGGERDEVEVGVGLGGVAPGRGRAARRRACGRRRPRRGPGTGSRRRAGWTIGASGSAPSARGVWWSVTTTSRPARAGPRDLLDRGDRAVDGDQQLRAAGGEALDGRGASGRSRPRCGSGRYQSTSAPSARSARRGSRSSRRRRRRSRRGR